MPCFKCSSPPKNLPYVPLQLSFMLLINHCIIFNSPLLELDFRSTAVTASAWGQTFDFGAIRHNVSFPNPV